MPCWQDWHWPTDYPPPITPSATKALFNHSDQKHFSKTDKCQQEWECAYGCAENRDRLVAAAGNGVDRNCLNSDTNYAGNIVRTLSASCADTELEQLYSDGMFSAKQCQTSITLETQACLAKTPYMHSIIILYASWLFTFTFAAVISAAQHTLLTSSSIYAEFAAAPPPYSDNDSKDPLLSSNFVVETNFKL